MTVFNRVLPIIASLVMLAGSPAFSQTTGSTDLPEPTTEEELLGCHADGASCGAGEICVGVGICVPEASDDVAEQKASPAEMKRKHFNILLSEIGLKPLNSSDKVSKDSLGCWSTKCSGDLVCVGLGICVPPRSEAAARHKNDPSRFMREQRKLLQSKARR